MSNDNPLNTESLKGDKIRNSMVRKRVVIAGQELDVSESSTQPRENGVYEDTETRHILTDHAGNPLPEDHNYIAISHTGLFITSPEQMAQCNYWLHPGNRSRIILAGQDGQLNPNGAICSHCASWPFTINIVLLFLVLGFFGGLLRAVGIF